MPTVSKMTGLCLMTHDAPIFRSESLPGSERTAEKITNVRVGKPSFTKMKTVLKQSGATGRSAQKGRTDKWFSTLAPSGGC